MNMIKTNTKDQADTHIQLNYQSKNMVDKFAGIAKDLFIKKSSEDYLQKEKESWE